MSDFSMTEEWVDVVDQHDVVVDRMPRSAVKELGLPHRAVHVMVETSNGRLVVQWRARHKTNPRMFTASAAGTVESGHSYDDTAARELTEELGITTGLVPLGKIGGAGHVTKHHVGVYACRHDGPFVGWEDEAERLDYWTPEECRMMVGRFGYLLTSNFRVSLQMFLDYKDAQAGV